MGFDQGKDKGLEKMPMWSGIGEKNKRRKTNNHSTSLFMATDASLSMAALPPARRRGSAMVAVAGEEEEAKDRCDTL